LWMRNGRKEMYTHTHTYTCVYSRCVYVNEEPNKKKGKKKRSGRNRKWRAWVGIPRRGGLHGVMRRLPAPQQLPLPFVSPWPFSALSTLEAERGGNWLLPLRNRSETIASEKKTKTEPPSAGVTPFLLIFFVFSSDFFFFHEGGGRKRKQKFLSR